MISGEGAALIATVYPIAVLVLVFESRSLPKMFATGRTGRVALHLAGAGLAMVVLLAVFSIERAVISVSAGSRLGGFEVVVITLTGRLLVAAVALVLLLAIAGRFGWINAVGRRANRTRIDDDPARSLALLDRLQRFNPDDEVVAPEVLARLRARVADRDAADVERDEGAVNSSDPPERI